MHAAQGNHRTHTIAVQFIATTGWRWVGGETIEATNYQLISARDWQRAPIVAKERWHLVENDGFRTMAWLSPEGTLYLRSDLS